MSLTIRSMASDEISLALDWAAAEGWNPGLADAECFAAADPAGFLLGEIAGEAVGCISATRYGTDFGFIGFYIMRPGFRGMGHGMALWRAAMARLEGRVIGLDGVVAQQANYQKSGFALLHRNIRYGAAAPLIPPFKGTVPIAAASLPFSQLAAFDQAGDGWCRGDGPLRFAGDHCGYRGTAALVRNMQGFGFRHLHEQHAGQMAL